LEYRVGNLPDFLIPHLRYSPGMTFTKSETQLFLRVFIVFGSASVVVAIVFGWLLHCLVVIVRARSRERTEDGA
jgi:MFS superfamily sulfate permease-like transporter